MPEEIKGKADFRIVTRHSEKKDRDYNVLIIKIGNYELYNGIFVNSDQIYIIKQEMGLK